MTGVWLAFPGADLLTFFLTLALLVPLVRQFRKASKENAMPQVGQ
jgi:hypothetical protein